MKALVTGGAGFVGTNLIKRLLKDGYDVTSVDNYSSGFKKNHQDGCRYYDFDLSSSHTLGIYVDHGSYPSWRDDEYDVIFHLSALARIQPSLKDPHKTIFNNFVSTLNILEYARGGNIPVVYAGSSSKHHGLWGSPYAWSKFGGEQLCELYNKVYNLPVTICRFYNVYGPYQIEDGTYATVIGIFEKHLTIVGDGNQKRDFTHIDDIVNGLTKCGDGLLGEGVSVIAGEIFEFGRGKNCSMNDIADIFGKDYPREYLPKRKGEYDVTLADYSRAKNKLGWNPICNIKDYLMDIIS